MKAEEFCKTSERFQLGITQNVEIYNLMEAYHKQEVEAKCNEAISNADIDTLISSIRTAPSRKDADAYAIYWFKQQLLNKIQ